MSSEDVVYPVPAREVRREHVVLNSRFIALLAPADTPEQARAFFARVRREFHDATHHVPAYVIGHGGGAAAYASDAGEPSGSAGRPILAVLRGCGLGDAALMVVRYFGGTKLGVGGLVRAYTRSAQIVVDAAPIACKTLVHTAMLGVPYSWLEQARRLIKKHGGIVLDEAYAAEVTLTFQLPVGGFDGFQADLRGASAGALEALILETALVRWPRCPSRIER